MKKTEGYVGKRARDNRWFARVTWTDENGKRIDRRRFGRNEHHAKALLAQMMYSLGLESSTTNVSTPAHTLNPAMPFKALADAYIAHKVTPAQYRNGKKVSGMRSIRTVLIRIQTLKDHFADIAVDRISVSAVERFKAERINTQTVYKTDRSIASVNRELETLRAILRFARNEGIIAASPFEKASSPLISKAMETRRTRVLSEDEETRLLAACDTPRRKHLIPVIIAGIDTGARKGELLALLWSDIDASQRQMTLRSETTKTQQTRVVPMSQRLYSALYDLAVERAGGQHLRGLPKDDSLVFGLTKFQNGWDAACEDAKIDGLRFHDLRASFISRLVERGLTVDQIAQVSGHSDVSTIYKHYLRKTNNTLSIVRDLLDGKDDKHEDSGYIDEYVEQESLLE